MQDTLLCLAARLTDDELLDRVSALAKCEREATVELVAHLVELDARKLHVAQGYGSLFSYCTEALRLAEHAAYNRIEAARACQRFPVVLDRLADGSLNLSTLRLLAPHLTTENHCRLLDEAARKTKREVEAIAARLAPRPDAPALVRRLPSPRLSSVRSVASAVDTLGAATGIGRDAAGDAPVAGESAELETPRKPALTTDADPDPEAGGSNVGGAFEVEADMPRLTDSQTAPRASTLNRQAPLETAGLRATIAPLSPERYRVQFTVGRETYENLRRAQELLRREVPDGDPGAIVERALKLLLADVARRKLAATSVPRPAGVVAAGSRHIPAHLKRAVWLRDGGRCAFLARSGRRCRERAFLEFHHVDPYAIGGETTLSNLSLRCRAHNLHEAERLFGPIVPGSRRGVSDRGHGELSGVHGEGRGTGAPRQLAPGRVPRQPTP